MEEIYGYIERITFQNPENGYTVAKLQQPKRAELTTVVGPLPMLQPGETVRCLGRWSHHPSYGRQFEVASCEPEAPADVVGIEKYLGSGLVKGIGPAYAKRIVARFGEETLSVIDQTPELLKEVSGIGPLRLEKIVGCWQEQKSIREVMIFLQKYGVSPAYAQKIFKRYGQKSIALIRENPFYLARDIRGIGFKSADRIAGNLGIAANAVIRIDAGIEYVLSELSGDGHVCFPKSGLIEEAAAILEVERELIEDRLEKLYEEERIVLAESGAASMAWLKPLYLAERGIVKELKRLFSSPGRLREIDVERALAWVQKELSIRLAAEQKRAVSRSFEEKLQIITGGPGTGKSTITRAILTIARKLTKEIILAAPTGRAAKRMSEITGCKASTIHSLLEYDFKLGGFRKNRENPLEADLLIVDEASMIDTLLMNSLLKALPDHVRILFVGDVNQLPSVGPGNVLKDLISCKKFPVTTLQEIFRQAKGSKIITNAHKINRGLFPDLEPTKESDFFFIASEEKEQVLAEIVSLVTERLPKCYGCDPVEEIQVLAPMKRGVIGTEHLNVVLQEAFNPKGEALFWGGRKYAVGDKVMQIRNNYKKEVYNGDVGRIRAIDRVEQEFSVEIDGRRIPYSFSELDELVLAYAVSIHKYQGSECPCIVMPVHTAHFKLLHRNLLYTGVTRGRKLVVLVGTKKAVALATKNNEVLKRHTALKEQLLGRVSPQVFPSGAPS